MDRIPISDSSPKQSESFLLYVSGAITHKSENLVDPLGFFMTPENDAAPQSAENESPVETSGLSHFTASGPNIEKASADCMNDAIDGRTLENAAGE